MRKNFLVLFVMSMSCLFNACSESLEELAENIVRDAVKCERNEFDNKKCDELTVKYRERKDKLSLEEQKELEGLVFVRYYEALEKNGK